MVISVCGLLPRACVAQTAFSYQVAVVCVVVTTDRSATDEMAKSRERRRKPRYAFCVLATNRWARGAGGPNESLGFGITASA